MQLGDELKKAAKESGFVASGVVDLDLIAIAPHIGKYDEWLSRGYHGKMDYLVRGRNRRADPRELFPKTASVFSVALPYPAKELGSPPSQGVRYASYLRNSDYHTDVADRLEKALLVTKKYFPALEWKVCVDTSAVLERSWAALAGVGWIGKNSMLIHPRHGSYIFLGTALLNLSAGAPPEPISNYCGNCTRCLNSCPTGAFQADGLDSRKCISYQTLENRGEITIRYTTGNWVAGCDICQDVCPFNTKSKKGIAENSENDTLSDWGSLLSETIEEYQKRVKHSALKRIKPAQFGRNLALAFYNSVQEFPELSRFSGLILKRVELAQDPFEKEEWEKCLVLLRNQSENLRP